jgi:hypothetical protein
MFNVALLAVAAGLPGCAYFETRLAAPATNADSIGVYEASPPGSAGYVLVSRLWVEPWKSAISVPRYGSVEAGAADLRNRAAALGGDAVMNFGCYHSGVDPRSDYYCNGTVIRFVK